MNSRRGAMVEVDASWSGEHPGALRPRLAIVGRGTVNVFLSRETNSAAPSIEVARPGSR
jgi:hypothetical protein